MPRLKATDQKRKIATVCDFYHNDHSDFFCLFAYSFVLFIFLGGIKPTTNGRVQYKPYLDACRKRKKK